MRHGLRNAVLAVGLVVLVWALLVKAWRLARVVLVAVVWLAAFLIAVGVLVFPCWVRGAQPTRRTPLGLDA
jgi:hypothetical protein